MPLIFPVMVNHEMDGNRSQHTLRASSIGWTRWLAQHRLHRSLMGAIINPCAGTPSCPALGLIGTAAIGEPILKPPYQNNISQRREDIVARSFSIETDPYIEPCRTAWRDRMCCMVISCL
jgi:hypothetical protein